MNIKSLQITIVVLLLGYPILALWFRRWRQHLERDALLAIEKTNQLLEAADAEAKETFMRGTRLLAEECAGLKIEVERARDVAGDERARTARYFEKITDFERERTTWQTSYYEQSLGHGNAQQLMINTIETLARQLQENGVRPQIPKIIYAIREEYQTQHEMPALAALEAIRAVEAAKASAAPTVASASVPPKPPEALAD